MFGRWIYERVREETGYDVVYGSVRCSEVK